jgi:hypothetical protein
LPELHSYCRVRVVALPNLRIAGHKHPLQCIPCRTTFKESVVTAQAQGMKRVTMSDIHLVDTRTDARIGLPDVPAVRARKWLQKRAFYSGS